MEMAKKITPVRKLNLTPSEMIFLIGSVRRCPQYWEPSTTTPMVLNKYTGSRGKSGSNDANAEFIAKVRRVFDDHTISFQTAELGKVDQGGGGTIAYIMGNYGMDVIDSGIAVLNMHAPSEIVSKADVWEAFHGYLAFLKDMKETF